MGLGPYPTVTLAAARGRAEEARRLIVQNVDPLDQARSDLQAARAALAAKVTFGECLQSYVGARAEGWKNDKHKAQWISSVRTHAARLIPMYVDSITTDDVFAALEPIWSEKTETATRVRQRVESVIDWATTKRLREGDNPARWRGHLENLLPAPESLKQVAHHAAVHFRDVPKFMGRLHAKESLAAHALRITVLSCLRAGEVVGARWEEFDMRAKVWTIPAHRMKGPKSQRRDHAIPLVGALLDAVRSLPRLSETYLFPGGGAKGLTLTTDAVLNCLQGLHPDYAEMTTHGFRSSFRDWVGDATDFDEALAELALAHKVKNKVEAAYRRQTALDKRRELMMAWGEYASKGTTPKQS